MLVGCFTRFVDSIGRLCVVFSLVAELELDCALVVRSAELLLGLHKSLSLKFVYLLAFWGYLY